MHFFYNLKWHFVLNQIMKCHVVHFVLDRQSGIFKLEFTNILPILYIWIQRNIRNQVVHCNAKRVREKSAEN